jgi:hypothetical protein
LSTGRHGPEIVTDVTVIKDASGTIIGASKTARDITELSALNSLADKHIGSQLLGVLSGAYCQDRSRH